MRTVTCAILAWAGAMAGCNDDGPEIHAWAPSYVSIDSPRPGTETVESTIHVEGEMDDEVDVKWRNGTLYGQPQVYEHGFWWSLGASYVSWRTWEADIPLEIGENTIVVTGTLPDGRKSEATIIVIRPAMIVTIELSGEFLLRTSLSTVTLNGGVLTASDAPVLSVICRNDKSGEEVIASGTLSWTADVPLVSGYNTITVTAVDGLGRTASRSRWVFMNGVATP